MEYIHGRERKKFMLKQIELQQKYRKAGMSEEDIREMFIHDLAYFNLCKREALHTVSMENADMDNLKDKDKPELNWLDEIDNAELYTAIQKMPDEWKEVIEQLINGHTHLEIAEKLGITRPAISLKVRKIKKILKNFL